MRLATFEAEGQQRFGLLHPQDPDTLIDLSSADGIPPDLLAAIEGGAAIRDRIAAIASQPSRALRTWRLRDVRLRPPVTRPGKLLCVAGNYRAHIAESGFAVPDTGDVITPQCFLKPSSALIADGEDVVLTSANHAVGWEVELAVVIGARARHVSAADAWPYVFGYTVINDVSERKLHSAIANRRPRDNDKFFDWLAGKWFDGFAPCGPWIVTADAIPDPQALRLQLHVNGEQKQDGWTGDMIFDIPALIAWAASIMTLEPGDILATGTPVGAGVGGAATLADGDEMVCEIEHIGRLTNRVRIAR